MDTKIYVDSIEITNSDMKTLLSYGLVGDEVVSSDSRFKIVTINTPAQSAQELRLTTNVPNLIETLLAKPSYDDGLSSVSALQTSHSSSQAQTIMRSFTLDVKSIAADDATEALLRTACGQTLDYRGYRVTVANRILHVMDGGNYWEIISTQKPVQF